MEDTNRVYRIRTTVGDEAPNVIHVPLKQSYDMFEILSLKLNQTNVYKTYESDYGVVVGRVTANGGFGVQNAKVSIFIEVSDDDSIKDKLLYNFYSTSSQDENGVRYNLLPDFVDDACHQDVGTFPNKRLVLDNQDVIDMFDKYWKYTTTTNYAGDYMIYGVPTGSQQLHVDVDLSDCGVLSQRPRDMMGKGYNETMFESPNKFKFSTNLDSLAQIISQNKSIYVYPYWGDISDGDDKFSITRCDINLEYKFESYAVFLGSIITDKGSNAIGKNCTATENNGKMSDLIAGGGSIEMIRKTVDGKVEEFPINGNRLIDGDGVWCYQIPMNLDYVTTDEFGNLVPTDNPDKGIATRTRVRFRISIDDDPNDALARKRAKYLVPNNPRLGDDVFEGDLIKTPDYEFGTNTNDESYCDMFWNKVYTVKNYIPKLQKNNKETNRKHTGIKQIKYYGDNNPMPYNSLNIKLGFTYRLICIITKVIINVVVFINQILSLLGAILGLLIEIIKLPGRVLSSLIPKVWPLSKLRSAIRKGWDAAVDFLLSPIKKLIPPCIGLDAAFCDDGINRNTYYVGCGTFFFNLFEYHGDLNLTWRKTKDGHQDKEFDECKKQNISKEECKETLTTATNATAMLYTCVENQLAQDNEATSFNFNNDWINGVLYAPLWYRKITPKRKLFFGLIPKKAKDEWCSSQQNPNGLRIIQQCTLKRDKDGEKYDNFDGKETTPYYVDKTRCGKKCHEKYQTIRCQNGVITPKETMLGQTVYYYKPVEYIASLPKEKEDENGGLLLLFATDIVLLGSLNECDVNGIPQFFKALESTTYNMPTDILFTDYDFKLTVNEKGESERVQETEVDVSVSSEMAGCDWGNPNEFGKKDGGLFYSIGCSTIELHTKSCINLSRICEFGVSLDESKEVADLEVLNENTTDEQINNDDRIYQKLITDGFVSWDELYNLDERSMFATMNGNRLKNRLDNKNGLYKYDFRYLYPENFDGSLKSIMEETTKKYPSKINYKNNYKLEELSRDYYIFRMGNNPYYYDGENRSFPRYENSFYFYFGLKSGKTAIEKFNLKYFSECFNPDSIQNKIGVKTNPNSWCSNGNNDGYVAFDFSNVSTPVDLLINGVDNPDFSIEVTDIQDDKVYISNNNEINLENNGYSRLKENETTFVPMLDNGSYSASIVDGDRNITEFQFSIRNVYLTFDVNIQNFEQPNNVLLDIYQNYRAIAEHKGLNDNIDITDPNNVLRKDIGGVISVNNIFIGSETLDHYKVQIMTDTDLEGYDGSELIYNNGTVTITKGINTVLLNNASTYPHKYAFGLPRGDYRYRVIVTQMCGQEESDNKVTKTVYVNEPLPYKMFINEVDYDVISNFKNKTGWTPRSNITIDRHELTENTSVLNMNNPWFHVDEIYYNNNLANVSGKTTADIIEFTVEKNDADDTFRIMAVIDGVEDGVEVSINNVIEEFTKNKCGNSGITVPYNWIGDYIVSDFENIVWQNGNAEQKLEAYDAIDSFIDEVNKVLENRRELVSYMNETFYMFCENTPYYFDITAQTDKTPYTQTVLYHPEKAVEYEDYNELDGDNLTVEDDGSISDIRIPTISYGCSALFGDGSDSVQPCIARVNNIKKKPYYAGVMNDSGISIPKDSNNNPLKNEIRDNIKYIKWSDNKLSDLFDFPLIDKILNLDYIAWSAFINIPKYGVQNGQPQIGIINMNGLLAGFIYNGNVINNKFNTQTLNNIDLQLSQNLTNKTQTYVEKRLINGFDYEKLGTWVISLLRTSVSTYVTQEMIDKINQILYPINITIDNIQEVINSLNVNNEFITYDDYSVRISDILRHILGFTNYKTDTSVSGNQQYAFILPIDTNLVLQDERSCGITDMINGALSITLSDASINDCRSGGKKILEVESDEADFFSIFACDKSGTSYPLNRAQQNGLVWQINDLVNGLYSDSSAPQNMFSFQMKTKHLMGEGGLIDTSFKSSVLVSSENEEEEYRETRGYGTTGKFVPDRNFDYPIFIVCETDNHVRALSPVYDYSTVTATTKYGMLWRKEVEVISDSETGTKTYNVLDPIQDYNFGVCVDKGHFYLDNYEYKLSATCIVDSVNTINIPENTLLESKKYIFANITELVYQTLKSKTSTFNIFGKLQLINNTTVTAIDYTTLKHICKVDGFTETTWYTYIWHANVPNGYEACSGISYGGQTIQYLETIYEAGDTVTQPSINVCEDVCEFDGWSENSPSETFITEFGTATTCKVFFGNWTCRGVQEEFEVDWEDDTYDGGDDEGGDEGGDDGNYVFAIVETEYTTEIVKIDDTHWEITFDSESVPIYRLYIDSRHYDTFNTYKYENHNDREWLITFGPGELTQDNKWWIANGSEVRMQLNENTEETERTLDWKFVQNNSGKVLYLRVKQLGNGEEPPQPPIEHIYVFKVEDEETAKTLTYEEQNVSIPIVSTDNGEDIGYTYDVPQEASYIHVQGQDLSVSDGGVIDFNFKIDKNESTEPRACEIILTQNDSNNKITLSITQSGIDTSTTPIYVKVVNQFTDVNIISVICKIVNDSQQVVYDNFRLDRIPFGGNSTTEIGIRIIYANNNLTATDIVLNPAVDYVCTQTPINWSDAEPTLTLTFTKKPDVTPSLKVRIFGVDSQNLFSLGYDQQSLANLPFTGAGTLFAEFEKENVNGIGVEGESKYYSLIEEYGILYVNNYRYQSWIGGDVQNNPLNTTVKVYDTLYPEVSSSVNLRSFTDENNTIFSKYYIINKAIRIPSSGYSSTVLIEEFPYTFDSDYFFMLPIVTYFRYVGNSNVIGPTDLEGNGSISSSITRDSNNPLNFNLNYNVLEENTGTNYIHHILHLTSMYDMYEEYEHLYPNKFFGYGLNPNCAVIHLIQEYPSNNRIYYGQGFGTSSTFAVYDDNYDNATGTTARNNLLYNAWIETCSSKILEDESIEIISEYVAYPVENFGYNLGSEQRTNIRTNYSWGNKKYNIIKLTNNKITFIKKTT